MVVVVDVEVFVSLVVVVVEDVDVVVSDEEVVVSQLESKPESKDVPLVSLKLLSGSPQKSLSLSSPKKPKSSP